MIGRKLRQVRDKKKCIAEQSAVSSSLHVQKQNGGSEACSALMGINEQTAGKDCFYSIDSLQQHDGG